jgi:hypothetical protein
MMNEFRLLYVTKLKKFLSERCGDLCTPQAVGTVDNIKYVSDIDINLNFSSKIEENLQEITKIYSSIQTFHHKYFTQDYSKLFDVDRCSESNIQCINTLVALKSQRLMSFSRLSQVSQKHGLFFLNPPDSLSRINAFFLLYNNTFEMINSSKTKKLKFYSKYLEEFYSVNKSSNFKNAATLFSLSKMFETDTYRSVGAYLHIVVGIKNLPTVLYMDSIIDNLGFAIENVLKSDDCLDIQFAWKMLRVAKYLERIIDAVELSKVDLDLDLHKLKEITKFLNMSRKENSSKELLDHITNFISELEIISRKSTNLHIKNTKYISKDELNIIQYILNFVIYIYSKSLI